MLVCACYHVCYDKEKAKEERKKIQCGKKRTFSVCATNAIRTHSLALALALFVCTMVLFVILFISSLVI